jgi:hypothetical protein
VQKGTLITIKQSFYKQVKTKLKTAAKHNIKTPKNSFRQKKQVAENVENMDQTCFPSFWKM